MTDLASTSWVSLNYSPEVLYLVVYELLHLWVRDTRLHRVNAHRDMRK